MKNDGVWSEAEQLTININCEASSEEHQYTVAHILGESKCRVYTPRHFYPIKRVVCQDPTSESEKTIWETEHPREFSKNVSVLSVTKTKNGYPDKYLCILQENNNYLLFLRDNELNNWVDITKTRVKLSKFQFFYNFKKLTPEEYEVKYEFLRFKILFKFGCNKVKYDGKKLIRKYIAGLEIDLSDSSIAFCDHSITLIMKTIVKHPDNLPGDLPENDEDADESGLKTQVISIK
ncbi:hypothetical protein TpMuguga_04g00136 [Theileria parva strain Muguga]|uniref:Uncharacterized protein n=1 Tax=Theileria parva TaxID=5875 RepID=Q4N351_THEPA|nr:uncharacterized protein TpMuguga_04g00136 [Theileria parva strain Muguga]EAN31488.1 hypothetical protein TpMuguga_04g00136 [Theileria parva strain Muguga]|eukprot:XP_763771.1 hypothetical protein [Theileria parva strain Muguga]